jgi:tetratricopeptide (TPR) repeat protein
MGRSKAAEKHFRRALELRRQHLGADGPRTLSSQRCLGATLEEAGRAAEATPILEDALKRHRAVLGSDNRETLLCLDNLAAAYARVGRLDEALALQTEALARGGSIDEPASPVMLRRLGNLGVTYTKLNRPADAVPLFEKALRGMKQLADPTHAEVLLCMNRLAEAYASMGAFDKSIPVFEELLSLQKKVARMDPFDPQSQLLRTMQHLAINYAEAGRVADLRALLKDYFNRQPKLETARDPGDAQAAGLLAQVGRVLLGKEQYGPAEEFLRECLKIRLKSGPEAWTTANARSLLGAALLGQKKYTDAAPLLLQGYEGLRKQAEKIPPAVRHKRLIKALERLVQLYDAWGKKDEADAWRKKLDEAKAAWMPQP